MLKRLFLLILLLQGWAAFAQQKPTKPVVQDLKSYYLGNVRLNEHVLPVKLYWLDTKKVKQDYYVDTATKKLHGPYKDFYPDGKLKAQGEYNQSYRAGVWEFYDKETKLMEKYNYDLRRSFVYNENPYLPKRIYAAMGAPTSHLDTLDTIPHFIGGMPELEAFFARQLKQPYYAWLEQLKGILIVSFVVDENGEILYPRVEKRLGFGCEAEALRVVRIMPRWAPAVKNDKFTAVRYYLPIEFDCTQ